jgi:hypothetical protein
MSVRITARQVPGSSEVFNRQENIDAQAVRSVLKYVDAASVVVLVDVLNVVLPVVDHLQAISSRVCIDRPDLEEDPSRHLLAGGLHPDASGVIGIADRVLVVCQRA